jgi:hypothetical protein
MANPHGGLSTRGFKARRTLSLEDRGFVTHDVGKGRSTGSGGDRWCPFVTVGGTGYWHVAGMFNQGVHRCIPSAVGPPVGERAGDGLLGFAWVDGGRVVVRQPGAGGLGVDSGTGGAGGSGGRGCERSERPPPPTRRKQRNNEVTKGNPPGGGPTDLLAGAAVGQGERTRWYEASAGGVPARQHREERPGVWT